MQIPPTEMCTVCTYGQDMSSPARPLLLDGFFPVSSCRDLANFAALLVTMVCRPSEPAAVASAAAMTARCVLMDKT